MKLDLLAIAAHPDDAELGCGGTLILEAARGRSTGILDLTLGELGTRGTAETRTHEALAAADILGLRVRRNLGLPDGFFVNDLESRLAVIRQLRELRPEIVLLNAPEDRHPDHGRGAALASDACFLSGLLKIETWDADGHPQAPWRPRHVYHYVQDRYLTPDFVVDITPHWDRKREAITAFKSQFNVAPDGEPPTYISSLEFWQFLEGRARDVGHLAGFALGEAFLAPRKVGVKSVFDLV